MDSISTDYSSSSQSKTPETDQEKLFQATVDEKNGCVEAAFNSYKELADKGVAQAMLPLALLLLNGWQGRTSQPQVAAYWFTQAAAQEDPHPMAFYYLGHLYEEGKGVEKNREQAIRFYLVALCTGNREAKTKLSDLLKNDFFHATDDLEKVLDAIEKIFYEPELCQVLTITNETPYYQIIIGQLTNAIVNLAASYRSGDSPSSVSEQKSPEQKREEQKKAAQLYQIAAGLGHREAFTSLGYMYRYENVVTLDWYFSKVEPLYKPLVHSLEIKRESFRLNQQEADSGNSAAFCKLGMAFQFGNGTIQNHKKAALCYVQALFCEPDNQLFLNCFQQLVTSSDFDVSDLTEAFLLLKNSTHTQAEECIFTIYDAQKMNQAVKIIFRLGDKFEEGTETLKQDKLKAVSLYEVAAELGNTEAMEKLAYVYIHGKGVPKNPPRGFNLYIKAARAGSKEALYKLGFVYGKGIGVTSNHEKAALCYFQAICSLKQNKKAKDNFQGLVTSPDFNPLHLNQALLLWKNLAISPTSCIFIPYDDAFKQTMADAICQSGKQCRINKEYDKAFQLFTMAHELGDVRATCELGYSYYHGRGILKNEKMAFTLFQQAAQSANPRALGSLGLVYGKGRGVEQDYEKAALFYVQAICSLEENNVSGYFQELLTSADFDPTHLQKALKLLENPPQPPTAHSIFVHYDKAKFIQKMADVAKEINQRADHLREQNPTEAFRLSTISHILEDAYGTSALGYMYYAGKGVTENKQKAFTLFQQAAALTCPKALHNLGAAYRDGISGVKDPKNAALCYIQAICSLEENTITQKNFRILVTNKNFNPVILKDALDLLKNPSPQPHSHPIFVNYDNKIFIEKMADLAKEINQLADSFLAKDEAEAVRLYTIAQELGNIEAKISLGGILLDKEFG